MKFFLVSFAVLFSVSTANAGYAQPNSVVIQVRIDQSGMGLMFFDKPLIGSPSCIVPAYNNALAFNTNTAGGKAIFALALSAKAAGTPLSVAVGTNTCGVYGSAVEDWYYGH